MRCGLALFSGAGILALATTPAAASAAQPRAHAAASAVVVAASGRIGPIYGHTLFIGRSTANDVRKAEGRKPTTSIGVMGRRGIAGRLLTYRIGKGKSACTREYSSSSDSPRLGSFESTCRDTRTATGTRFGMTPRQVQGHQFALGEPWPPLGHDCSLQAVGVATSYGSTWLVVWMKGFSQALDRLDAVKSIAIYGANAVLWASACE
jgi:hypothetical protein